MQKIIEKITLILLLFINFSYQQYCFQGNFPKLLGSNNGQVKFSAVDMDTDRNIVVGGMTTDTTIAASISNANPAAIVAVLTSGSQYKFIKVIEDFRDVTAVRFTKDNSELFVQMNTMPNQIIFIVLNANNGNFRRYYDVNSHPEKIGQFAIDTNNRVYSWFQRSDNYLILLTFDGNGVNSGQYIDRYYKAYDVDQIINEVEIFDNPIEKQIIYGGYTTNSTGQQFTLLLNFQPNSGFQLNKALGVDISLHKTVLAEIVDLYSLYDESSPKPYYNFGCLNLINRNIILMRYNYGLDFSVGTTYMYYHGQPSEGLRCRGTYAKNDKYQYAYVFAPQYNQFKLLIMEYTNPPSGITMTQQYLTALSGSSNLLVKGIFYDEVNSYYIANAQNINFVNKYYSHYTGVIMSYYNGESCVPFTLANLTGSPSQFGVTFREFDTSEFEYTTSLIDYSNSNPYNSFITVTVASQFNSWCTQNMPLTFQFPSNMNYEYELYTGPKYYQYREFITIPYCEDATFNTIETLYYTRPNTSVSQSNLLNYTLPNFIEFNYANKSIKIESSDQNDVYIYYFGCRSMLTQKNNYLLDQLAYIVIKNPCEVATITPSVTLQEYTYKMQNGTITVDLPSFTYNHSVCEKVYELYNQTEGESLSSVFTYDNSTSANVYKLSMDTNQISASTIFEMTFASYYLHSNQTKTMKTITIKVNIYDCYDAELFPPTTFLDQDYNIDDDPKTINLQTIDMTPYYECGSIQYYAVQVNLLDIEIDLPSYIEFDDNLITLSVETSDVAHMGDYQIRIYVNATDYNIINHYDFTLKINCLVRSITPIGLPLQNYAIQTQAKIFNFDEFIKYPNCPYTFTYKSFEEGKTNLPSFITFNEQNKSLSMYSIKNSDAKKYDLTVRGIIINPTIPSSQIYSDLQIALAVISTAYQITNIGPPIFKIPLEDQMTVVNKEISFSLPQISEPDNEPYTIDVQLGNTMTFVTYNYPTFKISPELTSNGTYSVKIVLKDSNINQKSSSYFLNIRVLTEDEANSFNFTFGNQQSSVIKSGFSPTLFAQLKQFDWQGNLEIEFTTDILVPNNISIIDNKVLRFKIIPSRKSQQTEISYTWSVVSIDSRIMKIFINFTNPELISDKGTDILQIIFMQNGRFIEADTNKPIINEYTLVIEIPEQKEPNELNAVIQGMLNTAETSMKTLMVGNLAVNIVMSTSLQYLWGMINVIQIISHLPLFAINFPENAKMLYSLIISISQFDILPSENLDEQLFNFEEQDPLNDRFDDMDIFTITFKFQNQYLDSFTI